MKTMENTEFNTKGGVDELLKICDSYLFKGEKRTNLEEYSSWIRENNEDMAETGIKEY